MSQHPPPPEWNPPPPVFLGPYQPPQPPPPAPAPPPPVGADLPPVRRSGIGALVAWIVILALASFVAIRASSIKGATPLPKPLPEPLPVPAATQPDDPDISRIQSPALLLPARYMVGLHALTQAAPPTTSAAAPATAPTGNSPPAPATVPATSASAQSPAPQVPAMTQELLEQLESTAKTPLDELRRIPVIGELAGPGAALDALNRFEREHEIPILRRDVDLLRALYARGPGALDESDRQFLIHRHGWFGRLAAAYAAGPDDPLRRQVLASARTMVYLFLALAGMGLVGLAAGLVLLVLAIIWIITGRIRRGYIRPAAWRAGPFAEAFAVFFAGYLVISVLVTLFLGDLATRSIWPSAAILLTLPLVVGWLRLRRMTGQEISLGMGWSRGRGVLREIGAGLAGYLAGLPIIALGMLVTFALVRSSGVDASHPLFEHPIDRPAEALGVFALACIIAPITEETMFRGLLFHHLRGRLGFFLSAIITSIIFAAIHPQGWAALPVLGSIAMVLAAIREWRGSIIASVFAHALNNGVATLVLLFAMR